MTASYPTRKAEPDGPKGWRLWLAVLRFENSRSGRWHDYFLLPFLILLIFSSLVSLIDETEPASWENAARVCVQEPPQSLQLILLIGLLITSTNPRPRLDFQTSLTYPLARRERANCAFVDGLWLTSMYVLGALLPLLALWSTLLLLAGQELRIELLFPYLRGLAWGLLAVPLWQAARFESREPWVRQWVDGFLPLGILLGAAHVHGLQLPDTGSWLPVVWFLLLSIPAQGLCWLALQRYYRHTDLTKPSTEKADEARKKENRLWAKVQEWSKGGP